MSTRLSQALDRGLVLPPAATSGGPVVVLNARLDADLGLLPHDRVVAVQPFRPDHDALAQAGFAAQPGLPAGRWAAALVRVPRARDAARDLVARAAAQTDGPVIVDGVKTDGVEALVRDLRTAGVALSPSEGPIAKAHGKLVWFDGPSANLADWVAAPLRLDGGFVTRPGVFSADGPDPASVALLAALPETLPPTVADLGAGWGFLSAGLLARPGLRVLHMVEADATAIACAREAVTDPRALFHWADARRWEPPGPLDAVVMNPPFHTGREADPALGAAFVAAAARVLAPQGTLWMVANRHLPYEAALNTLFREVAEVAGDTRFKIIRASHPAHRGAAGSRTEGQDRRDPRARVQRSRRG